MHPSQPLNMAKYKKIFLKIHLWLSIPAGIIITITCLSGALLTFEKELMELTSPHTYRVEHRDGERLPLSSLLTRVQTSLPEGVEITGATLPSDPQRTIQIMTTEGKNSSVYTDPYTGKITGKGGRTPFFQTLLRLHRWILDSPRESKYGGKVIVGISTLALVFILISGFIVWLPKSWRSAGSRLRIRVDRGLFRFWHSLHTAGGAIVFPLLLLMALTGLTWSFGWYRSAVFKIFGVEKSAEITKADDKPAPQEEPLKGSELFAAWQNASEEITKQGDFERIMLSNRSAWVTHYHLGNAFQSDRYDFDRRGNVVTIVPYSHNDSLSKARGWIYSLHVGAWAGIVGRILTCLAALVGAALAPTGYYLWIRRLRRSSSRR